MSGYSGIRADTRAAAIGLNQELMRWAINCASVFDSHRRIRPHPTAHGGESLAPRPRREFPDDSTRTRNGGHTQAIISEYAKLATTALEALGGRVIIGAKPAKTHEAGVDQSVVVVEFESLEKAIAAYESDA